MTVPVPLSAPNQPEAPPRTTRHNNRTSPVFRPNNRTSPVFRPPVFRPRATRWDAHPERRLSHPTCWVAGQPDLTPKGSRSVATGGAMPCLAEPVEAVALEVISPRRGDGGGRSAIARFTSCVACTTTEQSYQSRFPAPPRSATQSTSSREGSTRHTVGEWRGRACSAPVVRFYKALMSFKNAFSRSVLRPGCVVCFAARSWYALTSRFTFDGASIDPSMI